MQRNAEGVKILCLFATKTSVRDLVTVRLKDIKNTRQIALCFTLYFFMEKKKSGNQTIDHYESTYVFPISDL